MAVCVVEKLLISAWSHQGLCMDFSVCDFVKVRGSTSLRVFVCEYKQFNLWYL